MSNARQSIFVGIDQGRQEHVVALVDQDGQWLNKRKFPHSVAGLDTIVSWLLEQVEHDSSRLFVAIERPDGPLAETLLARGINAFHLNPKQLDRFRDRHSAAGSKDDTKDAYVLGDSLRTDRKAFHPIQAASSTQTELREYVRIADDLKTEENALGNRLLETLGRYHLAMLPLWTGGVDLFGWALLEKAPTPEAGRKLSRSAIAKLLTRHRIRRLEVQEVLDALKSPAVEVSEQTIKSASEHALMLVARLRVVHQQRADVEKKLAALLKRCQEPTEDSTSADAPAAAAAEPAPARVDSSQNCEPTAADVRIMSSFPGIGTVVLATLLAEAPTEIARRDQEALRTRAGVAPVTRQSGKSRQVTMRWACSRLLRNAMHFWANAAVINEAKAKKHYAELRARGCKHSRALRSVADRLISVLMAMLRRNEEYNPAKRQVSQSEPTPSAVAVGA